MPTNVEIKARVRDRSRIEAVVRTHATAPAEHLQQVDTFFHVPNGRLKLRVINGTRAELIRYDRPDEPGPKASRYSVTPVENAVEMRQTLADAHGIRATVRKTRSVYLVGQTRVHLDTVDGLGEFVELEVVLTDGQTEEAGRSVAQSLMHAFDIGEEELVDRAYVDLLGGQPLDP